MTEGRHAPSHPVALWARAVDLVCAMGVFYTLEGFYFGSGDDLAFTPWLLRWEQPELLRFDLRFGDWPNLYYLGHLGYLFLVGKVMPVEWGLALGSIVSRLLLLIALQRLAERLAGRFVPAALFAVLLVGYFNSHLVGGYYLSSPYFSTHYPAIALVLLALDRFISGRFRLATICLLAATALNPRVGVLGMAMVAIAWFWSLPSRRQLTIGLAAVMAGVASIVVLSLALPASVGAMPFDELLRVWVYIRSPAHYAPASWRGFIFINFTLAAIFLVIVWRLRPAFEDRRLCFVALILLALVLVGLANNYFYVVAALIPANPFQFGPFILALIYVLMAAILVERICAGRLVTSLLVLAIPDFGSRLVLLGAAIVLDRWLQKSSQDDSSRTTFAFAEGATLVIQLVLLAVLHSRLEGTWLQINYTDELELLRLRAVLIVAGAFVLYLLQRTTPFALATWMSAVLVASAFLLNYVAGFRDRYGKSRAESELCEFVRNNTERDAVFMVPQDIQFFQTECRRTVFVSFSHLPLRLEKFPEWIERLRTDGTIPRHLRLAELNRPVAVDFEAYLRLGREDLLRIKQQHPAVGYALVGAGNILELPLAYQNDKFRLYRLP